MPRLCLCCISPRREALDAAVLEHQQGYRGIARQFGVSYDSLQRHVSGHLRETLLRSEEGRAMLDAEALAARMRELDAAVSRVLARGEQAGDDRLVLLAVKEGRLDVETLARLAVQGDVEERLAALEAQTRLTPPADAGVDASADAGAEDQ